MTELINVELITAKVETIMCIMWKMESKQTYEELPYMSEAIKVRCVKGKNGHFDGTYLVDLAD